MPGNLFHRDAIRDLLAYHPAPGQSSRKHFLRDALDRLEEGQHLYSCVRDNQLLYAGWLIERPSEVFVLRILPDFKLPAGDALIMGLYECGPTHESPLAAACLDAMLADLAMHPDIQRVMIAITPGHRQIPLLEAAGFSWETSLFADTLFGNVHRWSQQVSPPAAIEPQTIQSPANR